MVPMICLMPWTSRVDPAARLVYTRVSGTLRWDDAVAHRAALAADPRFEPTFHHVLDLSGVDRVDLTTPDVMDLAGDSILVAPARQAIVAPADVVFGISRMYDSYRQRSSDHEQIEVCRTLAEARARLALNIPDDVSG